MIKLIKSTFYKERATKAALKRFISNAEILSFSKQCELFEKNFAKYQGANDAIFVNSGSSANLAIIQALLNLGRLKKGDKVGFSAITWSTNVMPLLQLGLRPVPIDVELDTLNVSLRTLSHALSKSDIKMLFLTNLLGFADDIQAIADYCKKQGIILIEDNCESLGSEINGTKLGNFGLASTFSFYVGHHMSTIEGGVVCTNDDDLATMLRLVRAHGWDRNLSLENQRKIQDKHQINSFFYSRYTFYDLGYNFRATEINGYLGNIQLQYIDEIVRKRERNFKKFSKLYRSHAYYPIKTDHMNVVSNFAVPIVCKDPQDRDRLVKKCNGRVEIRPIVGGAMTEQPFFKQYASELGIKGYDVPNAKLIHANGLYFGNNPELTAAEINEIIKIFS